MDLDKVLIRQSPVPNSTYKKIGGSVLRMTVLWWHKHSFFV
jgi:hypothetical protein